MKRNFLPRAFRPIFFAALLCLLPLGAYAQGPDQNAPEDGPVAVSKQYDPAYLALISGNVYVDPSITHGIDAAALQQASSQSQDNPHTPVKIVILRSLPPAFLANVQQAAARDPAFAAKVRGRTQEFYTFRLHKTLNLDKEPLIVVTLLGPNTGPTLWTTALDAAARDELQKKYTPLVNQNPQDGTVALAQATASAINSKEYRSTAWLWIVFLIVVAGIAALIVSAGRKKRASLAAARPPVDALRENVLQGIEYLDNYGAVLPKNNPDSDLTRAYRQGASAKYEQAVKILDRATEMTDLGRAQALLTQAQADVQSARSAQDQALGNTANIPGDDALRPPPLPDSQRAVDAVPASQRGVSFFSGRPAPLGSLVPVTLTLGSQSRQVLVTPDEADELRQGRMPEVRAFESGGQSVPWYAYNGYDPYRDYWRYENSGWGSVNGFLAGYVAADLLGGLLMPSYGMGYSPYAFATDMPSYQQSYSDPGFGGGGYGGDFGGGSGVTDASGFDATGYDPQSMSSGFDTSGFDPGSGSDPGGFDSGGGGFDSGGFDGGGVGDGGGGGGD